MRPVLVVLLTASGLALLITSYTGLAWALGITALVGMALWGAVDATLHVSEDWRAAGLDRTTWVALMGIGAPLGVGLVATPSTSPGSGPGWPTWAARAALRLPPYRLQPQACRHQKPAYHGRRARPRGAPTGRGRPW